MNVFKDHFPRLFTVCWMPRLSTLQSRTAVEPSKTSTSWWTDINWGSTFKLWLGFDDNGLLNDGLVVGGTGDPWVVMLAKKDRCETYVIKLSRITWSEENSDDDREVHDLLDDEDPDYQAGEPEGWILQTKPFLLIFNIIFCCAFFRHWQDFTLTVQLYYLGQFALISCKPDIFSLTVKAWSLN